jgi:hypothetical protein
LKVTPTYAVVEQSPRHPKVEGLIPIIANGNGGENGEAHLHQNIGTKGGSITVPLTSCLTGLETAV